MLNRHLGTDQTGLTTDLSTKCVDNTVEREPLLARRTNFRNTKENSKLITKHNCHNFSRLCKIPSIYPKKLPKIHSLSLDARNMQMFSVAYFRRRDAVSAKLLALLAKTATPPVMACQRSTATSQYSGLISIARQTRPAISAAMMVVPLPLKGS